MTDTSYLARALADLPAPRRHAVKVALCEARDRRAAEHDPALAELWNAVAVTIADIEADERALFRRLQGEIDGGQ